MAPHSATPCSTLSLHELCRPRRALGPCQHAHSDADSASHLAHCVKRCLSASHCSRGAVKRPLHAYSHADTASHSMTPCLLVIARAPRARSAHSGRVSTAPGCRHGVTPGDSWSRYVKERALVRCAAGPFQHAPLPAARRPIRLHRVLFCPSASDCSLCAVRLPLHAYSLVDTASYSVAPRLLCRSTSPLGLCRAFGPCQHAHPDADTKS